MNKGPINKEEHRVLPDLLEADMRLSLMDPFPERADVGGLSLEGGEGCFMSGTEGGANPPWSWSISVKKLTNLISQKKKSIFWVLKVMSSFYVTLFFGYFEQNKSFVVHKMLCIK